MSEKQSNIESAMQEHRLFAPSAEFSASAHINSRAEYDRRYRESIENPSAKVVAGFNPIMPTFQGQVSPEQLIQIISFIKSLQITGGQAAATPAAAAAAPAAATTPNAVATPQHNPK